MEEKQGKGEEKRRELKRGNGQGFGRCRDESRVRVLLCCTIQGVGSVLPILVQGYEASTYSIYAIMMISVIIIIIII